MSDAVFISYSRRDLEFVTQLHQYLTRQDISAWFDQSSIEAGDQWRESIVNGIIGCQVFLLIISPDSAASNNVRREIDLADHHKKQILPVLWRSTEFPPSIQYQLAGIQYLDFKAAASAENFSKLAGVLTKLLGGAPVVEAAPGEPTIQAAGISPQSAAEPTTAERQGRGRGRGTAQEVSAVATGIGVMTKVVTQITSFTTAEQDGINDELKWLFTAADNFLKVRRGEVDRSIAVPVPIPSEAEIKDARANNAILSGLDDFSLQMIDSQIQSIVKQINIYMRNLAFELDKEAQLGGAAAANIALKNSIIAQQKSIAERTQELAKLMQQVYGVLVYGPADLVNQFP
ncbi:MAG: toll/interleukin-1 receptor domain-containing protein [Chloroflexota bacterium]